MRKARALLVSAVLATGLLSSVNAAPALAAEQLRGVYYDYLDCERAGRYGYDQGWWGYWRCVGQYNYYFLYA
ncbi:hypothetical protein [Nonomuraea sp. SYSU D8015]|uniref:hypothetical protein n=1 Tax=Nonomuraea sp. SYSU D8015 TaxID=2593644 RepID=UPI0016601468|nr:hypothetical protein [Nonomuraea sp. SYSU D8015]